MFNLVLDLLSMLQFVKRLMKNEQQNSVVALRKWRAKKTLHATSLQRNAQRGQFPIFQRGLGGFSSNGRIYDPLVGQFMQADNYIQTPEDFIGYNRYAYCRYNPFKFVDPSGESLMYYRPSFDPYAETHNPISYYSRIDELQAEINAEKAEELLSSGSGGAGGGASDGGGILNWLIGKLFGKSDPVGETKTNDVSGEAGQSADGTIVYENGKTYLKGSPEQMQELANGIATLINGGVDYDPETGDVLSAKSYCDQSELGSLGVVVDMLNGKYGILNENSPGAIAGRILVIQFGKKSYFTGSESYFEVEKNKTNLGNIYIDKTYESGVNGTGWHSFWSNNTIADDMCHEMNHSFDWWNMGAGMMQFGVDGLERRSFIMENMYRGYWGRSLRYMDDLK